VEADSGDPAERQHYPQPQQHAPGHLSHLRHDGRRR
jgi:hypothetical protein